MLWCGNCDRHHCGGHSEDGIKSTVSTPLIPRQRGTGREIPRQRGTGREIPRQRGTGKQNVLRWGWGTDSGTG